MWKVRVPPRAQTAGSRAIRDHTTSVSRVSLMLLMDAYMKQRGWDGVGDERGGREGT